MANLGAWWQRMTGGDDDAPAANLQGALDTYRPGTPKKPVEKPLPPRLTPQRAPAAPKPMRTASVSPEKWSQQRTWDDVVKSSPGNRTIQETVEANSTPLEKTLRESQRRVVPKADNSERAQRQFAMFNKAMRRELTDEEWGRLTSAQQQQVQFNGQLLKAYDADQEGSRANRSNMKGLISQLDLNDDTEKSIIEGLGSTVGPVVRLDELFAPKKVSGVLTRGTPQSPFTAEHVATMSNSTEQGRTNEIAAKLNAYFSKTAVTDAEAALPAALARQDEYNFVSPYAKETFEKSFDYLLAPDALNSLDWPTAAAGIADVGLDPNELKDYLRDRVQMLPKISGQLNLEALDSWFGK